MMELAGIFAYDLNTMIVAGPVVALALFSLAVAWLNHVPTRVRAFDLAPVVCRMGGALAIPIDSRRR